MRQTGFIALPALAWGAIAAGVVIVGLGAAVKFQSFRLETCKTAFEAFKAKVVSEGELAQKAAKMAELANQKAMEAADREYSKTKGDLARAYAAYRKLRDSSASRPVSSSTPVASGADRTCYRSGDVTKSVDDLEKSVFGGFDRLDAAVPSVLEQGDIARTRLQGSMKWATSLAK